MTSGLKQGSVLSPLLFSIYLDELHIKLADAKIGCYVGGKCFNHFAYADDLAIIAPSAKALNKLLLKRVTGHKSIM